MHNSKDNYFTALDVRLRHQDVLPTIVEQKVRNNKSVSKRLECKCTLDWQVRAAIDDDPMHRMLHTSPCFAVFIGRRYCNVRLVVTTNNDCWKFSGLFQQFCKHTEQKHSTLFSARSKDIIKCTSYELHVCHR